MASITRRGKGQTPAWAKKAVWATTGNSCRRSSSFACSWAILRVMTGLGLYGRGASDEHIRMARALEVAQPEYAPQAALGWGLGAIPRVAREQDLPAGLRGIYG